MQHHIVRFTVSFVLVDPGKKNNLVSFLLPNKNTKHLCSISYVVFVYHNTVILFAVSVSLFVFLKKQIHFCV